MYTGEEERRVLRKMDRGVVLFIAGLYLLSFLDRSNIGNARIAGLQTDLRMTGPQYEWLLTAFYISYIAFEWMALMFRLVPPHIYISICVLAWGIIASLQALTTSFVQMLILRAVLGVAEAAFCGVPFYLSFFFRRAELAGRVGVFISASPLATSFASAIAWLITWTAQGVGIAPWRALFLVEGFPSVLVAVYVWRALPDGPDSAAFLTPRERRVAVMRLRGQKEESHGHSVKLQEILATIRDPKSWMTAFMFFSCNVAFSSLPVFLPTIIHEMGFSPLASQAMSAPPYMVAFFTVLLTAHASDRARARSPFIILHAGLACAGYTTMFLCAWLGLPNALRYLAVYPAASGFFSCVTLILTWTLNNQASDAGRGAGVALLQYIGQCGPLLGTRLYPSTDGPLYLRGTAVCAGFMALAGCLAWGLRTLLRRENARIRAEMVVGDQGEEGVELLEGREASEERFMFML
ncbi:MFS general substrate transporter [Trichodelitschia bisporula]|uniref:MFS general substrate transporter n=1 Tax=Trichodelitschia bisporula TaxID=703511 RepID=A0A6G1HI04_9PEZI|nr:MFS general substrate transporter [Trichodelitschia bisporula]